MKRIHVNNIKNIHGISFRYADDDDTNWYLSVGSGKFLSLDTWIEEFDTFENKYVLVSNRDYKLIKSKAFKYL